MPPQLKTRPQFLLSPRSWLTMVARLVRRRLPPPYQGDLPQPAAGPHPPRPVELQADAAAAPRARPQAVVAAPTMPKGSAATPAAL